MNRQRKDNHSKEAKPFVGDTGLPFTSAQEKTNASLSMVLFSLCLGCFIGFAVWGVFWLSTFLTELLWTEGYEALSSTLLQAGISSWWIPILFCTTGGLLIGLWTTKFGGEPESLEKVMATVKTTGEYKLKNPFSSVVGFLLPLIFGGSVGPEAGLTGIIAAACTKIGNMLKSAGLRLKELTEVTLSASLSAIFATPFVGIVATYLEGMNTNPPQKNPENYALRKKVKLVLYSASAFGAVLGIFVFTLLFGNESGLPRFDGITPGANNLWWFFPCMLTGYVGALLYHAGNKFFGLCSKRLSGHSIIKPLIAGAIIGCLAIPLPYVLFPGEAQAFELIENWQQMGAWILLATGLCKCLTTPFCLHFGWNGGHFFPCIFAGIACGYGLALLLNMEAMFAVAITTATLLSALQRKPFIALALLLLCFPVESILWMGIACVIGAVLPLPKRLCPGGSV